MAAGRTGRRKIRKVSPVGQVQVLGRRRLGSGSAARFLRLGFSADDVPDETEQSSRRWLVWYGMECSSLARRRNARFATEEAEADALSLEEPIDSSLLPLRNPQPTTSAPHLPPNLKSPPLARIHLLPPLRPLTALRARPEPPFLREETSADDVECWRGGLRSGGWSRWGSEEEGRGGKRGGDES